MNLTNATQEYDTLSPENILPVDLDEDVKVTQASATTDRLKAPPHTRTPTTHPGEGAPPPPVPQEVWTITIQTLLGTSITLAYPLTRFSPASYRGPKTIGQLKWAIWAHLKEKNEQTLWTIARADMVLSRRGGSKKESQDRGKGGVGVIGDWEEVGPGCESRSTRGSGWRGGKGEMYVLSFRMRTG